MFRVVRKEDLNTYRLDEKQFKKTEFHKPR